jgi:hypothetical protein
MGILNEWKWQVAIQMLQVILDLGAIIAFARLHLYIAICGWGATFTFGSARLALLFRAKHHWIPQHFISALEFSATTLLVGMIICGLSALVLFGFGIVWIVFGVQNHDGMEVHTHWPMAVSFFVGSKSAAVLLWDLYKAKRAESPQYQPISS